MYFIPLTYVSVFWFFDVELVDTHTLLMFFLYMQLLHFIIIRNNNRKKSFEEKQGDDDDDDDDEVGKCSLIYLCFFFNSLTPLII